MNAIEGYRLTVLGLLMLTGALHAGTLWTPAAATQLRVEFTLAEEREGAFQGALRVLAAAHNLRLVQGATLRSTRAVPSLTLLGSDLLLDVAGQPDAEPTDAGQPMVVTFFCQACGEWTAESSPLLTLLRDFSSTPPKMELAQDSDAEPERDR